jgi:hypothetical protein
MDLNSFYKRSSQRAGRISKTLLNAARSRTASPSAIIVRPTYTYLKFTLNEVKEENGA